MALPGAVAANGIWTKPPAFSAPVFLDLSKLQQAAPSWAPASSSSKLSAGTYSFQSALAVAQQASPSPAPATKQHTGAKRWSATPVTPGSALYAQLRQQAEDRASQKPRSLPRAAAASMPAARSKQPPAILSKPQKRPLAELAAAGTSAGPQKPAVPAPAARGPAIKPSIPSAKPTAPALKKQKLAGSTAAPAGGAAEAKAPRKKKPAEALDPAQVPRAGLPLQQL